jgi:hypothetical protein
MKAVELRRIDVTLVFLSFLFDCGLSLQIKRNTGTEHHRFAVDRRILPLLPFRSQRCNPIPNASNVAGMFITGNIGHVVDQVHF